MLEYVSTVEKLGDLLTKPLPFARFDDLIRKAVVFNQYAVGFE